MQNDIVYKSVVSVSEIDRFQSKIANSPPLVFCIPVDGVSLGIGHRRWQSTNQNDGATRSRKKVDDIFRRLGAIHQCDGQTDRLTAVHRATAKTALTYSIVR